MWVTQTENLKKQTSTVARKQQHTICLCNMKKQLTIEKVSNDEYDNEMKQNNLITEIIGDFHINKTRCKQSTVNPSHKQV